MRHYKSDSFLRGADDRWRKAVADALWIAFPSRSANALAKTASGVLGISDGTILRMLGCEHRVDVKIAMAVFAVAGGKLGIDAFDMAARLWRRA